MFVFSKRNIGQAIICVSKCLFNISFLFFLLLAVRIGSPFILSILLIQVYKRSGTPCRFAAVVLPLLECFYFQSPPSTPDADQLKEDSEDEIEKSFSTQSINS